VSTLLAPPTLPPSLPPAAITSATFSASAAATYCNNLALAIPDRALVECFCLFSVNHGFLFVYLRTLSHAYRGRGVAFPLHTGWLASSVGGLDSVVNGTTGGWRHITARVAPAAISVLGESHYTKLTRFGTLIPSTRCVAHSVRIRIPWAAVHTASARRYMLTI
jgi:hypothetical protein